MQFYAAASSRRYRLRPSLERCEPRTLMTTYTVTALTDGGAGRGTSGDLRYCIAQANHDGHRDTIQFAVTGTIQLGSPLPALTSGRGITIDGPGAGSLVVKGGGAESHFTILRVKQGALATISRVTFANGSSNESGGAIFNGGNLTVSGMTFIGNIARRNGGAINNVGSLKVIDTTLTGNNATVGGAINNFDGLTITNSTITGNSASDSGGGVDSSFAPVKISGTSIDHNSAEIFGGGISLNGPLDLATRGGSLTLVNSTLDANRAGSMTDGTGYGGAIGENDSVMDISGTAITNNTAGREAGGVGVNGGDISLTDSNVSNNATGGRGGGFAVNGGRSVFGLDVTNGATLAVNHATFIGNSAGRNGGAIQSTLSTLNITDSVLSTNSATGFGGAISLDIDASYRKTHGSLVLAGSSITANSAGRNGGGISSFDQLTLRNTTVTGNLAGGTGGGVYNGGRLMPGQSTITANQPNNTANT